MVPPYSCSHIMKAETPPSSPKPAAAYSSLDPLTSSSSPPSCSNGCLYDAGSSAEIFCFNRVFASMTDAHLRPSLATSSDCPDHHELNERAGDLPGRFFGPTKRLCEYMDVPNSRRLVLPDLSSSSSICKQPGSLILGDWQRNEVESEPGYCAALQPTSGKYFDDVLDLLLQGVDAMAPTPIFDTTPDTHRNERTLSVVRTMANVEAADAVADQYAQVACEVNETDCRLETTNTLMESEDSGEDLPMKTSVDPPTPSSASSEKSIVERTMNGAWPHGRNGCEQQMEIVYPMKGLWEAFLNQRPSNSEPDEQQHQNSTSVSPNTVPSSAIGSRSNRWAGPTLTDVESALAITCCEPATSYFPPPLISSQLSGERLGIIDSSTLKPQQACLNGGMLHRETASFVTATSLSQCKASDLSACHTAEEDDRISTWRRLQKRNQMEPRYTVKIRCEEDAVNDGYRWRKYGQKSIKNSPYPRSYYRCSSGKCGVKKQVERSTENAGVLVVSYEGVHLHHRPRAAAAHYPPPPSMLSQPQTAWPIFPTCQDLYPPLSLPTSAPTHDDCATDNSTSPTTTSACVSSLPSYSPTPLPVSYNRPSLFF